MSETTEAPRVPQEPRPPDIDRRTLTPFGYAVCVVVPIVIAAIRQMLATMAAVT